jgi:hypothetical protein
LSNPALFGLCVGATVGVLDVGIGVVGGAAAKTRMYNGRCDHSEMPPSVPNPNPLQVHLKDVVTAAMLNVAKNSTRLLAPPIQNAIEGRPDGTISRLAADRIDIQIDGIGGFASNAIHQVLMLGPGEDYRSRLLLRGDLDKVIDKSQQTWGQASMDALKGAGQGALGLFSSTGPVAVVGTIAGFISALISSNASIDATSTRAHEQAANATIPPDRMHYQTALAKRASSTSMMGMMTAAIPGVVLPAVGLAVEGISAHVVDKLSARLAQWSAGGADGRTPRREVEEPEVVVLNERGLRVEDPTHTHF